MTTRRWPAVGGLAGPAAFITAWSVLGARTAGYAPTRDAISRLAAVDAPTRPAMTAGLVAFGLGVPVYALALRSALPGRAWMAAAATGVATLGVAAFPLGSPFSEAVHGVFAAAGYVSLAAVPVLAAAPLRRLGHGALAGVSLAIGAVSGACLLATAAGWYDGLLQRAGLSVADAWIMASAVALLAGARPTQSSVRRTLS